MAHRASVGFGSKAADRAGESRILRGDAHLLAQRLRSEIRSARPHRSLKLRMNPNLVKELYISQGLHDRTVQRGAKIFFTRGSVPKPEHSTSSRTYLASTTSYFINSFQRCNALQWLPSLHLGT